MGEEVASARGGVVIAVLAVALSAGCGQGRDPAAAAPAGTLQTVRVSATGTVLQRSADAAQIGLDLEGDALPVDELIAALEPAGKPDEVRRWSVESVPGSPAGIVGRVVVPIYALSPGDYQLVLWRGDADVVGRYRFSVSARPAD